MPRHPKVDLPARVRAVVLRLVSCVLLLAACVAHGAPAQPRGEERAQRLFEAAKSKVFKIRVVLQATQSQASVGSGFAVSADGLIVTNFHVVSGYLDRPEQYRIEFVRHDGSSGPLRLINVDVVHDLALLRLAGETSYFDMLDRDMAKGERGFSIGNPHDLGLTIVEGTYNGLIVESLYERILFSGAINPGMSGGPAITREGTVFGVNVARLVDAQLVSFLVPVDFVRRLVSAARDETADAAMLMERVRGQLVAAQDDYLGALLSEQLATTALGPYRVPDKLGRFMRCWGRSEDERGRPYRGSAQNCSSEDAIFVFDDVRTGSVDFEHVLLESRGMGSLRFYNLLSARFSAATAALPGGTEDFTPFRCQTEFVSSGGLPLRTALCVRAYKRLEGLYDFWLRAATLDAADRGLLTTMALSGVSFDNGTRFVRRYLEGMGVAP
jgi:serine protease Do